MTYAFILSAATLVVTVAGPTSAQSLADVLAATEGMPEVSALETAPEPQVQHMPQSEVSVPGAPRSRNFEDLTDFDITPFLTSDPTEDRLRAAFELLAYLKHQVAIAPDTPLSVTDQPSWLNTNPPSQQGE